MTGEQIEKSLKCCQYHEFIWGGTDCNNCPYRGILNCKLHLHEDALDYINRIKDGIKEEELE